MKALRDRRHGGAGDPRTAFGAAHETPTVALSPRRTLGPVAAILLKEAWGLRLKLSGFEDIENPNDPDGLLRDSYGHTRSFSAYDQDTTPADPGVEGHARAEYYRQLGVQAHSYRAVLRTGTTGRSRRVVAGGFGVFPISTAVDRKILRMKSDGVPYDDICRTLKIGHGRYSRVVRQAEERMRKDMKMGTKDRTGTVGIAAGGLGAGVVPAEGAQGGGQQQSAPRQTPETQPSPLATRALTDPTGLAREYASAAAEILAAKQLVPQSRVNAVRLLKLAIEMLVG